MTAVEASLQRLIRPVRAVRRRHWAALLGAAAVLATLAASLKEQPTPLTENAAAVAPAATATQLPLVCVTRELICEARALPSGYPCSCAHPLRGALPGTIVPMGVARQTLDRTRYADRSSRDGGELGLP